MKAGDRVRYIGQGAHFQDRIGVVHGPVNRFGVWWIWVEWLAEDTIDSMVLEEDLEVVNESR